jgi:hypothetical protein
MGRALRAEQFAVDEISIIHAVQRCVRRAFLAGVDRETGKDFGFRREWIRRRLEALASVFGIDVLSYAILSNHMHLILRNRPDVVASWSDEDVAIRWLRVFPGRRLEEHLGEPTKNDVEMLVRDQERLTVIRARLSDISWFMRALSEPIARMANKQDDCTGRFWEGRFKAQRLVDEAGLLVCSMYVDLNPVRAAMAESPESSRHTSAYDRIKGAKGQQIPSAAFDLKPVPTARSGGEILSAPVDNLRDRRRAKRRNPTGRMIRCDAWLTPMRLSESADDPEVHKDGVRASNKGFLGISVGDYMRLLRWTAQRSNETEPRKVPASLQPLLSRLGFDHSMWHDLVWNFKRYFGQSSCAGSPAAMISFAESTGRRWPRGHRAAATCFA